MSITVKEIVTTWLKEHGFNGLYAENEDCGCDIKDLMFCCEDKCSICKPGYKVPCCHDDEHKYDIVERKP